jgi:hypothetical protein
VNLPDFVLIIGQTCLGGTTLVGVRVAMKQGC